MNETANICMTAVQKEFTRNQKIQNGKTKQNVGAAKNNNDNKETSHRQNVCVFPAIHDSATFHSKRICEHVPRTIRIEREIERACENIFQCAILK